MATTLRDRRGPLLRSRGAGAGAALPAGQSPNSRCQPTVELSQPRWAARPRPSILRESRWTQRAATRLPPQPSSGERRSPHTAASPDAADSLDPRTRNPVPQNHRLEVRPTAIDQEVTHVARVVAFPIGQARGILRANWTAASATSSSDAGAPLGDGFYGQAVRVACSEVHGPIGGRRISVKHLLHDAAWTRRRPASPSPPGGGGCRYCFQLRPDS